MACLVPVVQRHMPALEQPQVDVTLSGDVLSELLDKREVLLSVREFELKEKMAAFEAEKVLVEAFNRASQDMIELNVGGVRMATTRATLRSV